MATTPETSRRLRFPPRQWRLARALPCPGPHAPISKVPLGGCRDSRVTSREACDEWQGSSGLGLWKISVTATEYLGARECTDRQDTHSPRLLFMVSQ